MVTPVIDLGIINGLRPALVVGGITVLGLFSTLGIRYCATNNYFVPGVEAGVEKDHHEQDFFDKVINHADRNNNGVLELDETAQMLRAIGYNPPIFYEGDFLTVNYSKQETNVTYNSSYGIKHATIHLNVGDLEKYVQKEMQ